MSARVQVATIVFSVLAVLSAGAAWLHERDATTRRVATAAALRQADSLTIAGLRAQLDAARAQVDTAWAVETVTVAHWRTLVDTLPPVTVRESVYVAACGAVVSACAEARERARAALAAAEATVRAQDSALVRLRIATDELVPRRSPCGWGATLGGVLTYAPETGTVRPGVGAAAGLTCRF